MSAARVAPTAALALAVACTGDPAASDSAPPTPGDSGGRASGVLLAAESWELVNGPSPFGEPPEDCPATAYAVESGFFEVESDLCAFAVFQQELPFAVQQGDPVEFVAWHLDLWAPEPTTATVVLAVGDERLHDEVFPVPGPEGIASVSATFQASHPAGTPAWWHIANHGYNSYRLGDVEVPAAR